MGNVFSAVAHRFLNLWAMFSRISCIDIEADKISCLQSSIRLRKAARCG